MDEKPVEVPKKLLSRMRRQRLAEKKVHEKASEWSGEYGYGAGKAHPSVEFATCPYCHQPPGNLCIGRSGPVLQIHYYRSMEFRKMKRAAREQLEEEEARRGRGKQTANS